MIPIRPLRTPLLKRCVSTVVDLSVIPVLETEQRFSTFNVETSHRKPADIPSQVNYVKDLYKFDRGQFQISPKTYAKSRSSAVVQDEDELSLKIRAYLKNNDIQLTLETIDNYLFVNPQGVKNISDIDDIFCKANELLRLSSTPAHNKTKEKMKLSGLIQKLMRFYKALATEDQLNDLIVEKVVSTLLQNDKIIQAYNVLTLYPRRNATLVLLNMYIEIRGDALPQTWVFPTGSKLDHNSNVTTLNSFKITVSDCMKLIQESGLTPNLTTLNTLVLAVGKSGNVKMLDEVVDKCWGIKSGQLVDLESALHPDLKTLTNIIYSYSYNGQLPKGLEVLNLFTQKYEFQFNDEFWCNLLRSLRVALPKGELKFELYKSIWKLIKAHSAYPSLNLYYTKLQILREFRLLTDAIETLPELYNIYFEKEPRFTKVVMRQYMSYILQLQAHKNLYNQSLKLVETWSPDQEFKEMMMERCKHYYAQYYKRMQTQMHNKNLDGVIMDEEDDDDDNGVLNLW